MQSLRQYGPVDDVGITDGDTSLVGVNTYDAPENLQPGQVQEAINMDFTSQDATTRGGFVCLPELGAEPFGYNWSGRSTGISGKTYGRITFGNGLYVAINNSNSNQIAVSANSINWSAVSLPEAISYYGIAYGNGLFVAVGPATTLNAVATSPDAITWTQRVSSANLQWNAIAYGNGVYVAVATNNGVGGVMTSPDGITWTTRAQSIANGWNSIVYGNGLFVAVGDASGLGTQRIMTSPDGVTWTTRTHPNRNCRSVTYGTPNGVATFVVVGNANASLVSYDGITWTDTTTAAVSTNWTGVAYGNGIFSAVSGDFIQQCVKHSRDGTIWFYGSGVDANGGYGDVTFGNNLFVGIGRALPPSQLYDVITSTAPLTVFASGIYSDPSAVSEPWIVLAGPTSAGFYSFGQTSRTVAYPASYTISEQSTIVQANNLLFIFSGPDQTPIQWDGSWGGSFIVCPSYTLGAGYEDIPYSNQGTYSQNRLWVVNGKDTLSASQVLDFKNFNVLSGSFNLNYGASDYVVCSYPFANNGLVVFKNRSVFLLQNVEGSLADVTSTEITRQIGIIGINAVTAVGPDLVYMTSDRNITSIRLNIQNATQAVTVPISQNINPIMRRVNRTYGYKVSMGYWNNLLFVAIPLDNATTCNTVLVYNFITNNWYGEWTFDASLNMEIQGFVTANYLGQVRMHAVTEDGRIFVVDEGQNDISGTTVAEISTSLTTRAYACNNENRYNRRMFADLSTNRPNFSVRGYVDGVNEYSDILTNQTYLRSQSWRFPAPAYEMDNSDDDFNQAFRKDYSTGPDSIQCGTGFLPEATQDYRIPLIFRRNGRLVWYKITNTTGLIKINSIGGEARAGMRNNLVQTG